MMGLMLWLLWWPRHRETTPFHWSWSIVGVSLFLSAADFMYFYSLSLPDAMVSIVSMIRRGSVVVSFMFGALFFHEKNLRSKVVDLALVLLGMLFLYIGSH
jgi:drug/metabolite transporter (DMT)-like permease